MDKLACGATGKASIAITSEVTAEEQAAFDRFLIRYRTKTPAPRLKVDNTGNASLLVVDHTDPAIGSALLMTTLGTSERLFTTT
jgi:hypothetical protein